MNTMAKLTGAAAGLVLLGGCGKPTGAVRQELERVHALDHAATPLIAGVQQLKERGLDDHPTFQHLGFDPADREKFRQSWSTIRSNLILGIEGIDTELNRANWKDRH